MRMHLRLLGLIAGVALTPAACGSTATDDVICTPACPEGQRCTATGCVSDSPGGEVDLAVAVDAAPACSPACGGATPYCTATGTCVACIEDAHCPLGQVCKKVGPSSICVPGCADDSRCAAPGSAVRCCSAQCVDTSKDAQNCGACGTVCSAANARPVCMAGQCVVSSCNPGWADCDANPANGCEVNLHADPGNCGACGMACKLDHAVADCAETCRIRACDFGWDDCDGKEANGCELNVSNNNANCGSCGAACASVPHARNNCVNAACQLSSCDPGYSDCDGMLGNGCEVATATDANNCGVCGMKCGQGLVCAQGLCTCPQCNLPNAKSTCINLKCVVAQCNVNWGDCDGLPQNGCEQNLTSDAKNCGQCGIVCAQGLVCQNGSCTCPNCVLPNARTACVNNKCVLDSCFQGFGNCDGNDANGCESDLSSDSSNCGACGKPCPMNTPVCLAAMCANQFCHDIGYAMCPSGLKQWCDNKPIVGTDAVQAQKACSQCFNVNCVLQNGDCAGPGYNQAGNGGPTWGYQAGCSGAAGRVWAYGTSFTTYGMWSN